MVGAVNVFVGLNGFVESFKGNNASIEIRKLFQGK
jgi:hypothetical protein